MKKRLIIMMILFPSILFAFEKGSSEFGPSPGMGNADNGYYYAFGAEYYQYIESKLGLGGMIEGFVTEQTFGDAKYRFSYLPISFGARYHFLTGLLKERGKKGASIFGGLLLFYALNLSVKAVENPYTKADFLNQYGLMVQLGFDSGDLFSKNIGLGVFIQYMHNMGNLFEYQKSATTTSYYSFKMIIIKLGMTFRFGVK